MRKLLRRTPCHALAAVILATAALTPAEVRFGITSDTHLGYDNPSGFTQAVLDALDVIFAEPGLTFVATAGDNVDQGCLDWQWDIAVQGFRLDSAGTPPAYLTPGNHDYVTSRGCTEPTIHRQLWTQKVVPAIDSVVTESNGDQHEYYSVDYENVHVAFIYDCGVSNYRNWLRNDMQNSTATWKVVISHCRPDLWSYNPVRPQEIDTIYQNLGVDLKISGHRHKYLRSAPLYLTPDTTGGWAWEVDPLRGVSYFMVPQTRATAWWGEPTGTGCCGDSLSDYPWLEAWGQGGAYGFVRVKGDTLFWEARKGLDASILDSDTLVKQTTTIRGAAGRNVGEARFVGCSNHRTSVVVDLLLAEQTRPVLTIHTPSGQLVARVVGSDALGYQRLVWQPGPRHRVSGTLACAVYAGRAVIHRQLLLWLR